MLNRTLQPELKSIDKIDFVTPRQFDIAANTKLYFMKDVSDETSRLDLYFAAGTVLAKPVISSLVNGLLLSGTPTKSSIQINEEIDALGGFYESNVSHENAVVSIYALRENLLPVLRIVVDAIANVAFFDSEVKELISDRKQRFLVNMEKVSFLAQRQFHERIFANSTYGTLVQVADFDNISNRELKDFYNDNYLKGLQKVVVVGNIEQDRIDEIIDVVGTWAKPQKTIFPTQFSNIKGMSHLVKDGALQTAIRVGRILFNKTHPDYCDFTVLNTILGDYFGSRLMSNIREDKGYTYGIGTLLGELHETGYFLIATEVGKDVKDATLSEIKNEITRLQKELVGTEELLLVKNYMIGQLLKSADGPYALTDLFLGVETFGLTFDFYNKSIDAINNITPERIQELAIKYLKWEDMTVVSAG
jgi:predicted Zn-dependent peptidase